MIPLSEFHNCKEHSAVSMRVLDHPVLGKFVGKAVRICFNGKEIEAYEGDSVAAALWAHGIRVFRVSEKYHEPRSIFCSIGLCTSCIMTVDGMPNIRTCIIPVMDEMIIKSNC